MATFSGNVTLSSNYTVPAGTVEDFDPNVSTTVTVNNKNFIVEGTLRMRPANASVIHTLRFTNIVEQNFTGGGLVPLSTDPGLWIMNEGVWDAVGTPKAGWNRTGDDSTWVVGDEMLRTPWNLGDFTTFAAHTKGTTPNSFVDPYGVTQTQEVFNLTRNVRVEGTATGHTHIFIHGHRPQTIKYVSIRYTGPRKTIAGQAVIVAGRYGLHFHHGFQHTRGSLVEGVVIRDSTSWMFVTHLCDGVTLRDCVAYDGTNEQYLWDAPDPSNDLLYDHCLAAKLNPPAQDQAHRTASFTLGVSNKLTSPGNNVIEDCVAVGNMGQSDGSGFHWPELGQFSFPINPMWDFDVGNIAHNNRRHGIFTWQNDSNPHIVGGFTGFRNGATGIAHGAYLNDYTYSDNFLYQNGLADLKIFSGSRDTVQRFIELKAANVLFAHHTLIGNRPSQLIWCEFGQVTINEEMGGTHVAGHYEFINCDPLEPSDFTVVSMIANPGAPFNVESTYKVQRSDGTAFRVTANGTSTVIPAFAAWPALPDGIESSEACGSPTVTSGSTDHVPTAIASAEALGTVLITLDNVVSPTSLDASGLGDLTVDGAGADPTTASGNAPLVLRHATGDEAAALFRLRRTSGGVGTRQAISALLRHESATTQQNPFVMRQTSGGARMRDHENTDIWRLRSDAEATAASLSELRTNEESVVLRGGTQPAPDVEGPADNFVDLFEVAPEDAIGDPVVTVGVLAMVPDGVATEEDLDVPVWTLHMVPTPLDPERPDGSAFESQLGPPVIDAGDSAQFVVPDQIFPGLFTPNNSGDEGGIENPPAVDAEGVGEGPSIIGGAPHQRRRPGSDDYGKYGLESRGSRVPRKVP